LKISEAKSATAPSRKTLGHIYIKNLDKTLIIVIQISILIISIIYFYRTENRLLKTAIGLFGLAFLGFLIRKFTGISLIGIISYAVIYPASIILFGVHLIWSENINKINKRLIGLIILTVLISFISKVFHLPGYGLLRLFSILPLGGVFYLNLKWLDKIREELRMVDLFAITMLIDLLIFSERYWS